MKLKAALAAGVEEELKKAIAANDKKALADFESKLSAEIVAEAVEKLNAK